MTLNLAFVVVMGMNLAVVMPQAYDNQFQKAQQFIEEEKYAAAIDELKSVIETLQARIADELVDAFPAARNGWSRTAVEVQQVGLSVYGGGLSLTARYKSENNEELEIQIITRSPMVEGLAVLMESGGFAASGQELQDIGGHKCLLDIPQSGDRGDLKMIVGSETLTTISARRVSDPTRVRTLLIDYAEAIAASAIARIAGR
jgi:hypothetical protein